MKNIRLSGREATVVRSLGFGLGMNGTELVEHARMPDEDLVDVLNGLMEVGIRRMHAVCRADDGGRLADDRVRGQQRVCPRAEGRRLGLGKR